LRRAFVSAAFMMPVAPVRRLARVSSINLAFQRRPSEPAQRQRGGWQVKTVEATPTDAGQDWRGRSARGRLGRVHDGRDRSLPM
jgi:hypothetical protein